MRLLTISVPKAFGVALLASFYILAFIISPYWMIPQSITANIIILMITIGLGGAWAYLSAADIQIHFNPKIWIAFALLIFGIVLLNYAPLTSAIPWHGDEEYHIKITLELANKIKLAKISWKWLIIPPAGFMLFLFAAWRKSKWAILLGAALLVGAVILLVYKNPFPGEGPGLFLRYPFVNYWFYALAPKMAIMLKTNPYHEVLYRLIPVFFAAAIAWIFLRSLGPQGTISNLLWGFSVATIPLLFYYSSILYLELPAVFLMTFVCFNIKTLLEDDADKLPQNPAWYALILIGFIKETTVPFLLCFLICRMMISLRRRRPGNIPQREPETAPGKEAQQPFMRYVANELLIIFSVLFPVFLYLLFRTTLTTTRGFVPELSNLWKFSLYPGIGQSFIEQFGLFLIFFLGGCAALIINREYASAGFFLLTFLVIPLFHAVDNSAYAGYSRFNLFVLPSVLTGANILIKQIIARKKVIAVVIVGITIFANLLISPIYLDGTKKPFWGSYFSDLSEHYYPYPEALSWLKKNHGDESILFTMNSPYYLDFYFNQLDWHPAYKVLNPATTGDESTTVSKILAEAERDNFNLVLYHVLGKTVPQPQGTGSFHQEKVIRNDAHILVIYDRTK